jgi:hypothetical protein
MVNFITSDILITRVRDDKMGHACRARAIIRHDFFPFVAIPSGTYPNPKPNYARNATRRNDSNQPVNIIRLIRSGDPQSHIIIAVKKKLQPTPTTSSTVADADGTRHERSWNKTPATVATTATWREHALLSPSFGAGAAPGGRRRDAEYQYNCSSKKFGEKKSEHQSKQVLVQSWAHGAQQQTARVAPFLILGTGTG